MTGNGKLLDEWLEDHFNAAIDRFSLWWGLRRARTLLRDKDYLRGQACHCPPGLPVHFVHSEGLREGADVVVDFGSNVENRRRRQLPVGTLAAVAHEIGDGDVVHVKADLLPAFLDHVFPRLGGPIVLVTGDSDFAPVARFRHLLHHPRLIHWFAQNCDLEGRHPKLTRIPIGFDNPRYSRLDKRIGFLLATACGKAPFDPSFSSNDMGDQRAFNRLLREAEGWPTRRPARALCTFHMNQKFRPNFADIPDRQAAFAHLRDNPACHFIDRRLSQDECWRLHRDFAFEISPRGKGLDCFRTWEALALGCIPIVKASTLDPLFLDEDLPVVIVESFAEIAPARLEAWRQQHAGRFTPDLTRRLTNAYWLEKIRDASRGWRRNGDS